MTVTVKLFAILRDRAGTAQIALDLPGGSVVSQAAHQLGEKYPGIVPYLSKLAYAVNEQYLPPTTELRDGDELALIPPVSGG